jgi:predicted nucleic acid-binding protein
VTRFVVDAPTLLHLVDAQLQPHPGHQLVAPGSIRSEALQLLLLDVRRGQRDEADALRAHERITETKMRLLGDRVSRGQAWHIARSQGWDSLRDAEYIAIARLQADALATVDGRLAARAAPLVRVAPVEELLRPPDD